MDDAGFAAYVHIPFCAVRCGYCDFNTYTNTNFGVGASTSDFHESLATEIDLSSRRLGTSGPLTSVFFGGGTPTMLDSAQLVAVLGKLRDTFGIAPGAEITTEANPETVSEESLGELVAGGFTRMSFGMQSAVPQVLHTLDRQHTPGQVTRAVKWARKLGLDVSVDLIYGAPGESLADWRTSLAAAIELGPDHISAYGLTIEPGTKMGAQLRRGEIAEPDPDELADKYLMAEELLSDSGYQWYEVSNWCRPGHPSRHNLAYWQNKNWWGYGPGAHSHFNGTRWWNLKHPLSYAARLASGDLPVADYEELTDEERREEEIMLGVRLREGISIPAGTAPSTVGELIADQLIDAQAAFSGRIQLTVKGRLLADTVIRHLW
ncbi:MAG: coproporphyrinogen III oxidase [Actinomycetaceae bacterium]|nr:coproporphyrinogen III oxidase [Actinomycetaceae bacterium]